MSEEEIQNILDELNTVRPEVLNKEAKRLFEAIMQIADDRDKYKDLYNKEKEKNELIKFDGSEFIKDSKGNLHIVTGGVISKDKIRKTIEEIKELLKQIDYHDIKDKNEREFFKKQYMQYVVARNILQGLLEDNI